MRKEDWQYLWCKINRESSTWFLSLSSLFSVLNHSTQIALPNTLSPQSPTTNSTSHTHLNHPQLTTPNRRNIHCKGTFFHLASMLHSLHTTQHPRTFLKSPSDALGPDLDDDDNERERRMRWCMRRENYSVLIILETLQI